MQTTLGAGIVAATGLTIPAEASPRPARSRRFSIIVHDLVYPDRGPFPIEVDAVPAVGELVKIDDETFSVKHVVHNYTSTEAPFVTIFLVRPGGLIRGPQSS
jgi:hypothetical protein